MGRRLARAYAVEWAKAIRRRFTPAGLIIVMAIVACMPFARPIAPGNASAYAFVAYATPIALNLAGLLLLVVFASNLMAAEIGGSIWLTLVRPIRRTEALAAKIALGMTYAIIMTGCVAVAAWALAYALGDLKGITYGGELIYTHTDMVLCYTFGILLSLFPQFCAVSYAIFISMCVRSSVSALAASVGIWLLVDVVKHPLHLAPGLFTSYVETPWEVFLRRCDGIEAGFWPTSAYAIGVSLAWFVVFTGLSAFLMARRDFRV
ncbi:MAG TPA: hypothetical protein P5318_12430 [Candidatus Hydrogenedentes bacterium]|nr:hypothetical protein [Candidatus Hydrogenedentota bacterium]HRT20924.1 hypothetical protein [Candidatus Hydrogenedentota bacterium]HRT63447.1 hypothetical protein [Candidatus Hydrogenedentota bacterium]